MKPSAFAYHAPTDVEEAVSLLAELGEGTKVLAGGQSLVPMMNMRLVAPSALVDITRITSLGTIEADGAEVSVGAAVTHERLRRDDRATAAVPLLHEALGWVAHPVIRHRGTAVGSVVHADPAAELPAVLVLLDGRVELRGVGGTRAVAASDFFLGPLESDLRPGELATGIVVPRPPPRSGTAFQELARRHGDYALAGVAVLVHLDDDSRIEAARACFLGVGDVPVLVDLGGSLVGQPADALSVDDAVREASGGLEPFDDIHATASYRRHLAGVLLGRAVAEAARAAVGQEGT